jgi:uncharacterized protein YbjT (DUF2867 family)
MLHSADPPVARLKRRHPVKTLVTGANGFIGSNLCGHLIQHGYTVVGLVRRASDRSFIAGLDPLVSAVV